ncbi:hypothetical protein ACHAWF_001474 [Thalassiosira exigua]
MMTVDRRRRRSRSRAAAALACFAGPIAFLASSPGALAGPLPRITSLVRGGGDVDAEGEGADRPPLLSSASAAGPSAEALSALRDRFARARDPYVAASPLCAAAVCRDGIALVSLHHRLDDDGGDGAGDDDGDGDRDDDGGKEGDPCSPLRAFRDLPPSTRGPLRIEPIHENLPDGGGRSSPFSSSASVSRPPPMALLAAGWRADAAALADAARDLVAEECRLYCLPPLAVSPAAIDAPGEGGGTAMASNDAAREHGRRVAESLSRHLALRTFSEGARSLSAVGLLACGGGGGSLRLVDETSAVRVRAHALGDGADALHERLVRRDFGNLDCEDGLRVLLRMIAEAGGVAVAEGAGGGAMTPSGETESKEDEGRPSSRGKWDLPPNAAVELALIRDGEGKMRRIRLESLFGKDRVAR